MCVFVRLCLFLLFLLLCVLLFFGWVSVVPAVGRVPLFPPVSFLFCKYTLFALVFLICFVFVFPRLGCCFDSFPSCCFMCCFVPFCVFLFQLGCLFSIDGSFDFLLLFFYPVGIVMFSPFGLCSPPVLFVCHLFVLQFVVGLLLLVSFLGAFFVSFVLFRRVLVLFVFS